MLLNYSGTFYISEEDLLDMQKIVETGAPVREAIHEIASQWDERDYALFVNAELDNKLIEYLLDKASY